MHLVGFIIRIYHDARSPERQIHGKVYRVGGLSFTVSTLKYVQIYTIVSYKGIIEYTIVVKN